jgi:hypothetical protein
MGLLLSVGELVVRFYPNSGGVSTAICGLYASAPTGVIKSAGEP